MRSLVKGLLQLILLLLITYTILRVTFGFLNIKSLDIKNCSLVRILTYGTLIDLSSILYINFPFFVFYLFILPLLPEKYRTFSLLSVFISINIFFLAINFIDLVYFKFNHRRSTIDLFYILPSSIHSFKSLLFQYWWLLLSFLGTCFILLYLTKKIATRLNTTNSIKNKYHIFISLFLICIIVACARGFSHRPISPSTPLLYFDPGVQPLVNNSTLNFIFSIFKTKSSLQKKEYYSDEMVNTVFPILKQYHHSESLKKKNVLLFILESFPESQLHLPSVKQLTPFFDSIRKKSTVAVNCLQNGHESVKGIVSILASVPPFLDEPLFVSNYNTIKLNGIGTLLQQEGYSTNFFLGAEYDHFNFAKLCKMVGVERYYSKDDVNDKTKDDGIWGIYDEYFFDFFSSVTDSIQQPFFNILYNISSHPPFKIPQHRRSQFSSGTQQQNAISYVDFCFSKLFKTMQSTNWFKNSIFVFIADHTFFTEPEDFASKDLERFRIPFFMFDPSDTTNRLITGVTQQLDLVPTILDKIQYSKPFISFGNSILKNEYKFSIFINNGVYQLVDSSGTIEFNDQTGLTTSYEDGDNLKQLNNQIDMKIPSRETRQANVIKAILQQYNNSLLKGSFH